MTYQSELGYLAAVDSTYTAEIKASNNLPRAVSMRGLLLFARGQYDSATALVDSLAQANPSQNDLKQSALGMKTAIAFTRGQINEGLKLASQNATMSAKFGSPVASLTASLDSAIVEALLLDSKQTALKRIEAGLSRTPISGMQALDRPYVALAQAYALAGRADLAREMMADYERNTTGIAPDVVEATRHQLAGMIALAERRYTDAVREARLGDVGTCTICMLPIIASAYDGAQQPDSAIAVLKRYVESTAISNRLSSNQFFLAGAYKRLGELLEAKGDRAGTAHNYAKFVELWKNADPALQPQVADVRKRLARLSDVEAR
jgi:tetratricopeptide (TPR) repeat protein